MYRSIYDLDLDMILRKGLTERITCKSGPDHFRHPNKKKNKEFNKNSRHY